MAPIAGRRYRDDKILYFSPNPFILKIANNKILIEQQIIPITSIVNELFSITGTINNGEKVNKQESIFKKMIDF